MVIVATRRGGDVDVNRPDSTFSEESNHPDVLTWQAEKQYEHAAQGEFIQSTPVLERERKPKNADIALSIRVSSL